jgi:hypothetical protein
MLIHADPYRDLDPKQCVNALKNGSYYHDVGTSSVSYRYPDLNPYG